MHLRRWVGDRVLLTATLRPPGDDPGGSAPPAQIDPNVFRPCLPVSVSGVAMVPPPSGLFTFSSLRWNNVELALRQMPNLRLQRPLSH